MLVYGYSVQSGKDPLVDLVDAAVDQLGQGTNPGAFLVDSISSLKYVPAWFPGGGWKRTAEKFKETQINMVNVPFHFVQEQMVGCLLIFRYPGKN